MTVCLAIVARDGVVLAADGLLTSGDSIYPNPSTKIEDWGEGMHVASAGSSAAIQKIRRGLEYINPEQLAQAVAESEDEGSVQFLVHYQGQVYDIDDEGGIDPVTRWAAIGGGGLHALGLMSYFYQDGVPSDTWLLWLNEKILPAVSSVNPTCGPPFQLEVFPFDGQ